MNQAEAEEKLNDYLLKGIVFEIFWADEAKALAVKIREHAAALRQTEYAPLIYRLQIMASDLETLAVAKLFDNDTRTRSIPNVLSLVSDNLSIWQLKDRVPLESLLMNEGHTESTLKSSSDLDLIKLTMEHYQQTLPHPANASQSTFAAALKSVRESRNKVHAHNEAIDPNARTRPTWDATASLVAYAKDFVRVIALALLGLSLGPANYYLTHDAALTGHLFERLLKQAKLID